MDSCTSLGVQALLPTDMALSSYSLLTCSVPTCSNNTAILESCCHNSTTSTFTSLSGTNYTTCTSTTQSSSSYESCLLRSRAQYFLCSNPNGDSVPECTSELTSAPPGITYGNERKCGIMWQANASAALEICCGAEAMVYNSGCDAYCSSNNTKLSQCLFEQTGGQSALCAANYAQKQRNAAVSDAAKSKLAAAFAGLVFGAWVLITIA